LAIGIGAGTAILTGHRQGSRALGASSAARVTSPALASALVAVDPPSTAAAPIASLDSIAQPVRVMTKAPSRTATPPSAVPASTAAAKPSAKTKPDCDPPSTTDERGHVHFKPECF